MKQVVIHMKDSALDNIKELGFEWDYSQQFGDNEIDVVVNDVDYDPSHCYKDPDEQLCDHYGIDYNQVNCIELV